MNKKDQHVVIQYILTGATQDGDPFNIQKIHVLSNALQYFKFRHAK